MSVLKNWTTAMKKQNASIKMAPSVASVWMDSKEMELLALVSI